MARLQLVAGDFGSGAASYDAGEFRFSKGRLQYIANVAEFDANATIVEKHWGRAVFDGLKNAAGLAPIAMLVGVFAAPIAAVGTIGIAAATVGGAIGLLGGGAENKALIQIKFAQGPGFIAVCELQTADTIRNDLKLMQAAAERERRKTDDAPRGWFGARKAVVAPPPALPMLQDQPSSAPEPAEETSATGGLAESVQSGVSSAAELATEFASQAWSSAAAFVRRQTGSDEK